MSDYGAHERTHSKPEEQPTELARWRGSAKTEAIVREEIRQRWGDDAAARYDPLTNCFTYRTWQANGYQVRKGEKAIRSPGLAIQEQELEDGTVERVGRKTTAKLFYITQVDPIEYGKS